MSIVTIGQLHLMPSIDSGCTCQTWALIKTTKYDQYQWLETLDKKADYKGDKLTSQANTEQQTG